MSTKVAHAVEPQLFDHLLRWFRAPAVRTTNTEPRKVSLDLHIIFSALEKIGRSRSHIDFGGLFCQFVLANDVPSRVGSPLKAGAVIRTLHD